MRNNEKQNNKKHSCSREEHKQEHTAAEVGLLWGELNKQVARIFEVQESVTLKITDIQETMSNKTAEVDKSFWLWKMLRQQK